MDIRCCPRLFGIGSILLVGAAVAWLGVAVPKADARELAYVANSHSHTVSVVDTATNTISTTIDLPHEAGPFAGAITPDGRYLYVANYDSASVSVVRVASNTVAARIPVGDAPVAVIIAPDGRTAYVSNSGSDSVSVIDTGGNAVTATVAVQASPSRLAIDETGSRLFVVNRGAKMLSVIDTDSRTVVATVGVNKDPVDVALSPDARYAYVTNFGSNSISVVDTLLMGVVATIALDRAPYSALMSPDGAFLYVTAPNSNSVSVIETSTQTVAATISVGTGPHGLALSPDGETLYVVNAGYFLGNGSVSVVTTSSREVIATVAVENQPTGLVSTPDGRFSYVMNAGSNTICVLSNDSLAVTGRIPLRSEPTGIAVAPDGAKAYITNPPFDCVYVLDTSTNTVRKIIEVGHIPLYVAVSPTGVFAYVTNSEDNSVSVIDTSSDQVSAVVPLGREPERPAVAPDGRSVYVSNFYDDTVSIIEVASNAVTAVIPVDSHPEGIAFDPRGSRAFVANNGFQSVSVIDTSTRTVPVTIDVGYGPRNVAFTSSGAFAYVTDHGSGDVSVIDTVRNTVATRIDVYGAPIDIAMSHEKPFAYVTSEYTYEPGAVSVIDTTTNEVKAVIRVGGSDFGVDSGVPSSIAIASVPNGLGPYIEFINPVTRDLSLIDPSGRVVADAEKLGTAAEISAVTAGATADGVTRLVLRTWSDSPVIFELLGGSADGCLASLDLPQSCGRTSPRVNPVPVPSSGRSAAFALYITPRDFTPNSTTQVKRNVVIRASNADGSRDGRIDLWRPPVVLMHGLWGDPGIWDDMVARLAATFDQPLLVQRSSYTRNAAALSVNQEQLLFDVWTVVEQLAAEGIAAVQVDVVAKSMGGLLARLYTDHPLYRRQANYRQGEIHKLITLDTPHCGSFLAALVSPLVDAEYGVLGDACFGNPGALSCPVTVGFAAIGMPLHLGAIQDLTPLSAAITGLKVAPISSNAVAGNAVPPVDVAEMPCSGNASCEAIRAMLWLLRHLGVKTVLVDRSDGVVEVASQLGSLPAHATQQFPVFHVGPAPFAVENNGAVGDHVAELIQAPAGSDLFAPEFPAGNTCSRAAAAAEVAARPPERVEGGIRIVSPSQGARFQPGQTVRVQLEPGNGFAPTETLVLTAVGVGQNPGSPLLADIAIPVDFAGELTIAVFATDGAGRLAADSITVAVAPAADPSTLRIEPSVVNVDAFPLRVHEQLRVTGLFPDGPAVDLTSSTSGTSYRSAAPEVATIGPDGLVTARSIGSTEITVTHGVLSEQAEVTVSNDLDDEVTAFTGDMNRDGRVDQSDIAEVIRRLFAGEDADVNRDERTSTADLTGVVRIAGQAAVPK